MYQCQNRHLEESTGNIFSSKEKLYKVLMPALGPHRESCFLVAELNNGEKDIQISSQYTV